MAVTIRVCVPLQRFTHGHEVIYHEEGSMKDILNGLKRQYPLLSDAIMSGDRIKDYFLISLNDKIINDADMINTIVKDGDEISIVPLVIGG